MKKRYAWGWGMAFVLMFLLSQDYLFTDWPPGTSWGGLPSWLGWFMLVHALFIGLFYYFAKRYWK